MDLLLALSNFRRPRRFRIWQNISLSRMVTVQ